MAHSGVSKSTAGAGERSPVGQLRRTLVQDGPRAWDAAKAVRNPLTDPRERRLVDMVLGAFLIADAVGVPGLGIPLPETCGILLLVLGFFRPPERSLKSFGLVGVLTAVLVVYLAVGSVVNDVDPTRRLVRIVVLVLLIYSIATERLDLRAILMGMSIAALINVPLFYSGIAPAPYGSHLTGYMGDKNVAGMMYALLPVLMAATTRNFKVKVVYLLLGFGFTFLTGSRTSLAALFCATLWMFLSPYLGPVFRLLLIGGMAWLVDWAERALADLSIFGDRTGTDWFREQVHEASWAKTQAAPWYGDGLSTAVVNLEQGEFFFHNSYWGLIAEGGYFFLVVVVGAYLFIGLRPLASAAERTPTRVAVEAGAVVIFVVSLQIGEAFITIVGALVLAAALLLRADELSPQSLEDKEGIRVDRVAEKVRRRSGLVE